MEFECFKKDYTSRVDVNLSFGTNSALNSERKISIRTVNDDNDVEPQKSFLIIMTLPLNETQVLLDDNYTQPNGSVASNATIVILPDQSDSKNTMWFYIM